MKQRIQMLDMLRGFALLGILYANIPSLAHAPLPNDSGLDHQLFVLLQYGFEQRFFPIFSFLFGVGFYIFVQNAQGKALPARRLYVRRLLILIGIGIIHQFLQPGEALLVYGIFGLWLLPFVAASTPVLLIASGILLVGGLASTEYLVVPAMFLLGAAAGKTKYFEEFDRYRVLTWVLLVSSLILSPIALGIQRSVNTNESPWIDYGSNVQTAAGLIIAMGLVSALFLAVQQPLLQRWLVHLAPFGRMALSNYIGQTVLVLALTWATGLRDVITYRQVALLWLSICMVQITVSHLWLRRFAYGPVEWLWRWGTYGHRPPLLNTTATYRTALS